MPNHPLPVRNYGAGGDTMANYAEIQALLDEAIGGAASTIPAHGSFWRNQTRDQFVAYSYAGQKLVAVGPGGGFDPDNSALIQALKADKPFGTDVGTSGARFRRMPAGKPPMPKEKIDIIYGWIAAGCPA